MSLVLKMLLKFFELLFVTFVVVGLLENVVVTEYGLPVEGLFHLLFKSLLIRIFSSSI